MIKRYGWLKYEPFCFDYCADGDYILFTDHESARAEWEVKEHNLLAMVNDMESVCRILKAKEKALRELADEWEQNASGTPQAIAARMWCIQELRTILNEGEKV